jgi:hypothetical protein
VTALAISELSTTEAFVARQRCVLLPGLFFGGPMVLMRYRDAWVQRRCPAGCMLRAQLPLDSQV